MAVSDVYCTYVCDVFAESDVSDVSAMSAVCAVSGCV